MDWPYLYARICAQTGWTWEYVGQYMTLPRLKALNRYWEDNPPLHKLLSDLLGVAAPAGPDAPAETATLQEFIADWQALGGLMG